MHDLFETEHDASVPSSEGRSRIAGPQPFIAFHGTHQTGQSANRVTQDGEMVPSFALLLNDAAWNDITRHDMPEMISPERLVGIGFRGWLAGYEYQDISAWEEVWNIYASALGPKPAKRAVSELSSWVRQVHHSSCRRIETYPPGCAGFCRVGALCRLG